MSGAPFRRASTVAATVALALGGLAGCAVATVAGTAAGAVVTVGSAAVSVGSAAVGTTVKVAGKVVEKTIDVALPSPARAAAPAPVAAID